MRFLLHIFIVAVFCSCGVLPKGVSYFGEEKIFSKQFESYPLSEQEVQTIEEGFHFAPL